MRAFLLADPGSVTGPCYDRAHSLRLVIGTPDFSGTHVACTGFLAALPDPRRRLFEPGARSGSSPGSPRGRIGGYGMSSGTIARLLIDKGFGFIRDETGVEHFFHRSAVRGAVFELLREGQRVEFSIEESAKGPRAGDVRLLDV